MVNQLSYITTYSKIHFTPTNPKVEDINIKDIAHAQSLMCRANGHFDNFFSVAQHSINCALEAKARGYSKKVQLACLLHDASEAYISDITRPVKKELPIYIEIEERLQRAIYDKFLDKSLTDNEHSEIEQVDDAMLYYEFLELMGEVLWEDKPILKSSPSFETRDFKAVENQFLTIYKSITQENCYTYFPNKNFTSVGIDGCKGKWVAVAISESGFDVEIINTINQVCNQYNNVDSMIIDMPIGLAETINQVRPDGELRKNLKGKASSVFNTPCRQAVYASNYTEAIEKNKKTLNVSISPLSNAIIPKIREVDSFLQTNPNWKNRLVESHPEYCFAILNDNAPILENKQTPLGVQMRLEVLSRYYPESYSVIECFQKIAPSSLTSKLDDVLDALVLAVIGAIGLKSGFTTLPEEPQKDSTGIYMQIVGVKVKL